jgi:hypothetical protein
MSLYEEQTDTFVLGNEQHPVRDVPKWGNPIGYVSVLTKGLRACHSVLRQLR